MSLINDSFLKKTRSGQIFLQFPCSNNPYNCSQNKDAGKLQYSTTPLKQI